MLPRILVRDRPFRRLCITRVLASLAGMASAFYVLYATRHLGFAVEVTGLFVSAQVIGSLASGLLMGVIQDRVGPLVHVRLVIVVTALAPLMALGAGPLAAATGAAPLPLFLLLNFCVGLSSSSMAWPFYNWIIEYIEETWRPLYIGVANTVRALAMLGPALGGWIASRLSYPAVFALAVLFAAAALAVSLPLLNTRQPGHQRRAGPHPGTGRPTEGKSSSSSYLSFR
jgi:MFS family permease